MRSLFPDVFYIPSPNATEEEICARMQELAEEYELTVFRVSNKDYSLVNHVKPQPKSLFLKVGGIRIPKYLHINIENINGYKRISTSMVGNVFSLPDQLLGQKSYFGVLVDDSKPQNTNPQTPT